MQARAFLERLPRQDRALLLHRDYRGAICTLVIIDICPPRAPCSDEQIAAYAMNRAHCSASLPRASMPAAECLLVSRFFLKKQCAAGESPRRLCLYPGAAIRRAAATETLHRQIACSSQRRAHARCARPCRSPEWPPAATARPGCGPPRSRSRPSEMSRTVAST